MPPLKSSRLYIGIDPGGNGGIAVLHGEKVYLMKMPETEGDLWNLLRETADTGKCVALLELVTGYVANARGTGSQMFKFGTGYGNLRMGLIAAGIPFSVIQPRAWQKFSGIAPRKKGESDSKWKNRIKARAQQLYPKLHITLQTADALLIAHYAKTRNP